MSPLQFVQLSQLQVATNKQFESLPGYSPNLKSNILKSNCSIKQLFIVMIPMVKSIGENIKKSSGPEKFDKKRIKMDLLYKKKVCLPSLNRRQSGIFLMFRTVNRSKIVHCCLVFARYKTKWGIYLCKISTFCFCAENDSILIQKRQKQHYVFVDSKHWITLYSLKERLKKY